MNWISVTVRHPRSFVRVWVMTDAGKQTTAYIKSNGEWFFNCPRIQATGAKVLRWRE
ncbi:TPA: 50S ribosomal protein L13 [Klebsiella variicola]|nr:50S ribosomal protein L13 [Klebsiella pneumoniae]HBX6372391.1 50S ribosomal protein L13 [Klebsiella pneumoniae]HBX9978371.1 50S ribosomal protein L13 [Klebsiella variicola]HBY6105600.1 50S ribosomal protein L13 [Klebsiella pneumoniae]